MKPPKTPVFGQRQEGLDYVRRAGAYALIERDDRLLIVDENSGWFLPGGGLEEGEWPRDALHREVLEETGYRIDDLFQVARVRQLVVNESDQTAWDKDCHIFTARATDRIREGDCELRWVPPPEAVDRLAHECFRWVVEEHVVGQ